MDPHRDEPEPIPVPASGCKSPCLCCTRLKGAYRRSKNKRKRAAAAATAGPSQETVAFYYNNTEEGQHKLRKACSRAMQTLNGGRLEAYFMPPTKDSNMLNLTLVTDETKSWAMDNPYRLNLGFDIRILVPDWFLNGRIELH